MPKRPPTEPTFTQTMQIGIVVPDLDAAVRTYRDGGPLRRRRIFRSTIQTFAGLG